MNPFKVTLIVFLFIANNAFTQATNCPPNIDFEAGDLSNWQCFIGSTAAVGTTNTFSLAASPPTAGRHEIVSATSGNDPYGNFPKLCPYDGQYSVKLGDDATGSQAEGMSYTFLIPPSADTFSLTYYYAVVFEDPGHSDYEQPRFFVSAYDVLTGNLINCASYNYVSNGSIPGFEVSPTNGGVLYKDWTPASIDFTGLAGRNVRLEFKTADCTKGGHFGYAYVDVGTGCGGLITAGAYCIATNSATLNGPFGFQTYKWYNSDYSVLIGTTRTVSLSPPPALNSIFHVDMVPYPGFGCRDTADAVLVVLPVPDTPVAISNISYCQFDNPTALVATASTGNELLWYSTPSGGVPSYTPLIPSTSANGTFNFYVTQKKLFGCESLRKKITVTISPTPILSFSINNARQCENGNNFLFTSTSTNVNASSVYLWTFGDGQTSSLPTVNHTYSTYGNYSVKLKISNSQNCSRELLKPVVVVPKPIANFTFPPIICENQTAIALLDNSTVPNNLSTVNSWWWSIDGNIVSVRNPPAFTRNGGKLPVKLVVFNSDGCKSDSVASDLIIHYSPIPKFNVGPLLCNNETIRLTDQSTLITPPGVTSDRVAFWDWQFDNVPSSVVQNPSTMFATGTHRVKLTAISNVGCTTGFADTSFMVHPKPSIALNISDSCALRNIVYTASNQPGVPVDKWLWNFGNGLKLKTAVEIKNYSQEGSNPITLIGQSIHLCKDTIIRPFTIYRNRSKAQRDTVVATNEVLQLSTADTINMASYIWTPSIGLSSTTISNPIATHIRDQVYELNTLTIQGCDNRSKIMVRRYDGPELYVPNAFTPNSDYKNDNLKIFPVGIKAFNYFSVYNRQGQQVFTTNNYYIGWDGYYKGVRADIGNYVWIAMATDYKGKILFRKGNVLLLR